MSEPPLVLEDFDDQFRWDAFVSGHQFGHVFQSWDWGSVQAQLGGRPHRIAAITENRMVGCVQTLVFESATRTFTYTPRGPVADPDDQRVAGSLLAAVIELSSRNGANLARVEPSWPDRPDSVQLLMRHGFRPARQHIMPANTMLVDLEPPLETIWMSFRSNTRNRVRLAEKRGVRIRTGGQDDSEVFVGLFEETTARHNLSSSDAEAFRLSTRTFGERDAMRLFLASNDGVDIAGIVVYVFGQTATYVWGGSSASKTARKANPNQLLHWTAIQWAREQGCTTYDLHGIPDFDEATLEAEYSKRNDGWWNLYRFKRGFRGRVHRHLGTFDCHLRGASEAP
jgi:lipid II:glycine glycyltransferase (peptidoglycan interpeptide bridge formation enzyme)